MKWALLKLANIEEMLAVSDKRSELMMPMVKDMLAARKEADEWKHGGADEDEMG